MYSNLTKCFTPEQKEIYIQKLSEIQRQIKLLINDRATCNKNLFQLRCEVNNSIKDMIVSEVLADYIDTMKLYIIQGKTNEELDEIMQKDYEVLKAQQNKD